MSPQWPFFMVTTDKRVDSARESWRVSFFEATALTRSRSALEPMTCPKTDAAIVNAMADLGIKIDFLSIAINGTAA